MLVPFKKPISVSELHKSFTAGQGRLSAAETEVDSFTVDSSEVRKGSLFIACRGLGVDGHNYIDQAFAAGAAAVVVADLEYLKGRAGFETSNARVLVSRLSNFAFSAPSQNLKVIGITGTNGKTSTNWFLQQSLMKLKEKSIRVGTLGYYVDPDFRSDDSLTTPPAQDLHWLLNSACERECKYAILEVSSHALNQHRVDDVSFDAAVFTNITHDHLDYHRTFSEYFAAKKRLFEIMLASRKSQRLMSVNLDTEAGQELQREYASKFEVDASFGYGPQAPVRIKGLKTFSDRSSFAFEVFGKNLEFSAPLFGRHNAENLAAAVGVLAGLGFENDKLEAAMSQIEPVPGRLEVVGGLKRRCFVDYAHTPDALEKVIICLKDLPYQKLIVVFGCGGDRDWRKRSIMGDIAAKLADHTIVTSDNPRSEDPHKIISDILSGNLSTLSSYEVIEDRAEAIKKAIEISTFEDIILIAGKGHEDYQIIGDKKIHFSDQEQVLKYTNCL
jgi:UDP-N-acetylmuramoyl-L-alanyl-D-glutamate--2,6-diaminopimelate ligase